MKPMDKFHLTHSQRTRVKIIRQVLRRLGWHTDYSRSEMEAALFQLHVAITAAHKGSDWLRSPDGRRALAAARERWGNA